jgi:XTP/dITP diphosphohydrolase
MADVVLATLNQHKIKEIKEIFQDLPIQFISLKDFVHPPTIVEDGKSFQENAIKKAQGLAKWTGKNCLADDSGIEVDYLKGAPGIYSARFSGENATDEENNIKLLEALKHVPFDQRKARYRCVMAIATPAGIVKTEEGTCEGVIVLTPKGTNGFGYDPLFYYPSLGMTFGELEPHLKNKLSHRYYALQKIKPTLMKIIQTTENSG